MNLLGGASAFLAAVGGAAGLGALVQSFPALRRLGVDTRKIKAETVGEEQDAIAVLSKTALEQMTAAVARARSAEAKVDACTVRLEAMEATLQAYREAAQDHVAWDHLVVTRLRGLGVDVPDAPPLLPRATPRTLARPDVP